MAFSKEDISEVVLDKSISFGWVIILFSSTGYQLARVPVSEEEAEKKLSYIVSKWLEK